MKLIWIVEARYIENFKIFLKFNDGKEGIVDLQNKLKGKIFIPLEEKEYFKTFHLNEWTIEWSNGADLAPEFLYDKVNELSVAT